jgi:hypothetical protein
MSRRNARSRTGTRSQLLLLLAGLVVLGVVAFGGAVLLAGDAPRTVAVDSNAPGRLVAEQTAVDLGRVPFDRQVEARFELANTGGDTVRLVGAPRVRMLEGC